MNSASRVTTALFALTAVATLGEGGGAVGMLLLWHSLLLVLVLVAVLGSRRWDEGSGLHPWLLPWAAAFATFVVVGALRAPYAYAAWLVVVELVAFSAVCFLAAGSHRAVRRQLVPALLTIVAAQGSYVLYQAFVLGRTRPAGTFLNTNHMSAWIVMVLLLAAPCLAGASRRGRIAMAALALPGVGALAVSSSRGALLGAAAGMGWLLVTRWGTLDRRARAAVITVAIVGTVAIGWRQVERASEDPFIHHRPLIWRHSIGVLADDPLWGSGPGQFPVAAARHRFADGHGPLRYDRTFRATHSDWLRGPVEFGVPASLCLVGLAATFAVVVVRRRRAGPWAPQDDGAVAALLALGAQAMVDNPSRWPAAWLLAAILAGRLGAVVARRETIRVGRPFRMAAAVVVIIVFLAAEVAPTLAWFRASAPDADVLRLQAAARWNPAQPLYWSRLADRTLDARADGGPGWLERYGTAREYAEHAVRLQPAAARFRLGVAEIEARACLARFRDTSCRARVLEHFAAAEVRSPYDATIPLQAAEFARRAGDAGAARLLAERTLALEPNAVPARLVLAETLLELDPTRAAEARRLLDEAQALAERYPGAKRKDGYSRVLLGFDSERAADVRRRSTVVPSADEGRAAHVPKTLTYAREDRPESATTRR